MPENCGIFHKENLADYRVILTLCGILHYDSENIHPPWPLL